MALVLPFLPRNQNFAPEQLAILGKAYDMVVERLGPRTQTAVVLEVVAAQIIMLAAGGDWDKKSLAFRSMNMLRNGDMRSPSIVPSAADSARNANR
jgi:hypothetical protein